MSLIAELQRRNVIRVAMAYIAVAWLIVQVLDTLAPIFGLSGETARLIVILLAIGLIPALVVSWLFELTPEGLRRESSTAPIAARASTRTLDRLIIVTLSVAVVYFAVDKFVLDPARDAEIATEAAEQARDEAVLRGYGDNSVAVLPFTDMSPERDQEYFSDGITEEIINLLAQVRDLRVISRSSAFSFKGQNLPVREVASRLDVRYVVEGSVRRAGDNLRITAYMVDARTDTQLWSENFDRMFGDVFAVQDEIAAEVVSKLEIELAGEMPSSDVVDPEAFALYLRAKELVNRQEAEATTRAEQLLEQSLALDDQQTAAWLLYETISIQKVAFNVWTWPEYDLYMQGVVEKVLAIDRDNVQARALRASLSRAATTTWAGDAQAKAYGMSLDPLNTRFNQEVGQFLRTVGLTERAIPFYEYGAERDPLSARSWRGLMLAQFHAGRFEEALEANTRLREITGGAGGLWYRGMIYLMLDDIDNAAAAFNGWASANPDSPHGLHGLVLANTKLGNEAAAAEYLAELEQADRNEEPLASAYAWLGRYEEALDILERIIDPPTEYGPLPLANSPLFPGLSTHPRWQAILEKQGVSQLQVEEMGLELLFPGPGVPPLVDVDVP